MIQNNKAIKENEFMPREKILLLQTISVLKRLGEDEELVKKLIEKTKGPKEEMLEGVIEQLTVLRDKYSEDSYGHETLHAIIVDMVVLPCVPATAITYLPSER